MNDNAYNYFSQEEKRKTYRKIEITYNVELKVSILIQRLDDFHKLRQNEE